MKKRRAKIRPGRFKTQPTIVEISHKYIHATYGKANHCESPTCVGKSKRFDWSNKDHKYTLNREDWQMLCASCHMIYDNKHNRPSNTFPSII